MSTEVLIGNGEAARLTPHPLRAAILGELHARPFTPLTLPSRILHFGFDTSGARAQPDRANLVALCTSRGLTPPAAEKHHRAPFGTTILRWEQHSEFTTYTWEMPADPGGNPFHPDAASLATPMRLVPQPGPLLVAVDLQLLAEDAPRTWCRGARSATPLAFVSKWPPMASPLPSACVCPRKPARPRS